MRNSPQSNNKKKRILLALFFFQLVFVYANAQDAGLAEYIKGKSIIKEGGTELFNYRGQNYLISVVSVVVGEKDEISCKKVGQVKAKKEMLSYVNGSEISSYTELLILEDVQNDFNEKKVQISQKYTEIIKETVVGMINQCTELTGWYSGDRSVYYYAIYKSI